MGYFQDVDNLMPGRVLYTWQATNGGAAMYDSSDTPKCWGIDNDRGRIGRGATLAEADQDEKQQYDAGL